VTVLLDANVLMALLIDDHVHHQAAENWFVGMTGGFATCPITQGSLMRLLIREGQSAQGIVGHRQVTDAYLAQLARARESRLATFDRALAKLHHDVAELVPDSSGRLDGRQSPTRAPATAAAAAPHACR
jgi:predicted nucleic acid-binding protein